MEQTKKGASASKNVIAAYSPPSVEKAGKEKGKTTTWRRRYECKNLKFLIDLFDALGETPSSYAQKTPNPESAATGLRYQLNADDMKLSKAKAIVDTLGYTLNIRLVPKPLPEIILNEDKSYVVRLPVEIKRNKSVKSQYENLDFLEEFINSMNISKRELAKKLNLSPGAIFTWFQTDDIAIAYLNKIKDAFDVNLEFNILTKK